MVWVAARCGMAPNLYRENPSISNTHIVFDVVGQALRLPQLGIPMEIETRNLTLIPHVPAHLVALSESESAYEKLFGLRIADGVREFLQAASDDYMTRLRAATAPDPWNFGFAVLHKIDHVMIGFCSFTGPPDSSGLVEIAYGIAPDYQSRGFATEAAGALIEFSSRDARVITICAHTLPETNASSRVLEKCGFHKIGEVVDQENNLVWRWERKPSAGPISTS
jgi:ribosomal-protein-alanine N-acetyltransferase